ncbi:pleckstrin homology domain-containing family F member 1 [Trichomycterus rosablanca]|uniref:pleckstrin homology domain-containing family F member 1 n=1 Tax=Trichomycterus rosablanca TaxID=2290929 RepID=UPI002F352D46
MDCLKYEMVNQARIQAVENSFQPGGKPLCSLGRVLIGEGRLLKRCRKRAMPKAFFLFNDILVYGSIVVPGRWNNHQQILRLEELEQENIEDGEGMTNQWILRTPRKSFFVSAASLQEKRAWMDHIERCRAERLKLLGFPGTVKTFASLWVPDSATHHCMRCPRLFTLAQRKHHCRNCGFVVCNSCSKGRAILKNISHKPVRVCKLCKDILPSLDTCKRFRGDSVEVPEYDESSDEEAEEQENQQNSHWYEEIYCYFNPENVYPPCM